MDLHSLFEARRNPEVNTGMRSKKVLEQIEPYFGRDDAFISMIEVPKIGIHPSTGHYGTPSGIYTYPLSSPEICNQFAQNRLPYVTWGKYVALVFAKPDMNWLSSDTSEGELAPYRDHLNEMIDKFVSEKVWKEGKKLAYQRNSYKADHAASEFYNEVWLAAAIVTTNFDTKDGSRDIFKSPSDLVSNMFHSNKNRPLFWNTVLRKLGFDGVIDHGTKMIYSLEPYQAVFLHKGAVSNYEIYRNGPSEVHGHGKTIDSAQHFMKVVANREMSTQNCINFLTAILDRVTPGISDENGKEPKYSVYNSNIRLSHSQIRRIVKWLHEQDPRGTEHAMGSSRIFKSMLWKVAGDLVE